MEEEDNDNLSFNAIREVKNFSSLEYTTKYKKAIIALLFLIGLLLAGYTLMLILKNSNETSKEKQNEIMEAKKKIAIALKQRYYSIKKNYNYRLNGNYGTVQIFNKLYYQYISEVFGKNPIKMGSTPYNNIYYLILLQRLFDHPKINKIVEIGFGDWSLMRKIKFTEDKLYIGFDVVSFLYRKSSKNKKFRIISDLHYMNEIGDLLIIKDVIMYWSNYLIAYFLYNIVPKFKYTLLTSCMTNKTRQNIKIGEYNEINYNFYYQKYLLGTSPNNCYQSFILPHWPS